MAVGIAGGITAASGGALPAAVGIGAVTGGTIAAVERHRHVKDDLATHSNEAGEYNLTREEHASKRRRMDHYMPAAATVSDMLASDAPRPTQFGQESRSLATLLDRGVTDYANQDNLTALAHRLGEIEARLVYSPRVRRGYINFSENGDTAEYKVEQRRLRLVQEFAGGRDALIAFLHEQAVAAQPAAPDPAEPAQPVDSDAPTEPIPVVPALPAAGDPDPANQPAPLTPEQLMENATNEADAMIAGWAARWERRLDRDRKAKNRRFQVYKAGTVALHGVRGAAIGALTGIGIDKLVELIGRHGGTTIEQKTRTQDVFTQSQAYNPQPVTIDGIETYIPQGTNVMPMPDGTYNLVMSGHQNRVLIEGITVQTDTSGQAHLSWDMQSSTVSSDNVNLTQPQHTVSNTTTMSHVRTSESRVSFADLVSRIKSRTWLHKSPPVSPNGDELRFHTVKQGSKLMLVPDGMGVSTNGQVSLNVPQAESAHELSYAFSKPGESGTPVVVDAQGSHGVLALDANDHTDFVHVEGVGQVREDVAAKLLLNEHALSQLPNGDIATEFYGHQDVFAEGGADNCPGLVEMIKPDGNGHAQVIATIHATGAPNPDIVTKQTHISSQSGPTYNQTVYDKPVVKISGEVVDKQVPYSVKSYTPVGTYHLPLTITPKFRGPLENLQTAQFARYAPHVTGGLDDEHVQAANGEPANHAPAVNGGEDTGNAHAHTPLRVVARENRYHRPTTEQLLLRDYVVAAVARGVTRELAKERFAALLVCIKGGEKAQEENTVTMHPQLREELKTLFTENFGEEENIDQMLDACFNALYSTGNIPEDEEIAKSYIHREMLALAQAYHAIQPSGETVYEAHTA